MSAAAAQQTGIGSNGDYDEMSDLELQVTPDSEENPELRKTCDDTFCAA